MVKQKLPILLKPIKQSYDFLEIFTDLVVSLRMFFATKKASLAWHISTCVFWSISLERVEVRTHPISIGFMMSLLGSLHPKTGWWLMMVNDG